MNVAAPAITPFSGLAAHYARGRQAFPRWVMELLVQHLPTNGLRRILDAGCGTGLATRQMAAALPAYNITGIDNDKEMLREAQSHPAANISYAEIDVSVAGIRFEKETFASVTAFSSMHWFWENAFAMSGLIDLLGAQGSFLAVNKNVVEEVVPEWPQVLQPFTSEPLRRRKEGYNPDVVLRTYGLETKIASHHEEELYTPEQALDLLQSSSLWKRVPSERQPEARDILSGLVARRERNRILTRQLIITAVLGIKS